MQAAPSPTSHMELHFEENVFLSLVSAWITYGLGMVGLHILVSNIMSIFTMVKTKENRQLACPFDKCEKETCTYKGGGFPNMTNVT